MNPSAVMSFMDDQFKQLSSLQSASKSISFWRSIFEFYCGNQRRKLEPMYKQNWKNEILAWLSNYSILKYYSETNLTEQYARILFYGQPV